MSNCESAEIAEISPVQDCRLEVANEDEGRVRGRRKEDYTERGQRCLHRALRMRPFCCLLSVGALHVSMTGANRRGEGGRLSCWPGSIIGIPVEEYARDIRRVPEYYPEGAVRTTYVLAVGLVADGARALSHGDPRVREPGPCRGLHDGRLGDRRGRGGGRVDKEVSFNQFSLYNVASGRREETKGGARCDFLSAVKVLGGGKSE